MDTGLRLDPGLQLDRNNGARLFPVEQGAGDDVTGDGRSGAHPDPDLRVLSVDDDLRWCDHRRRRGQHPVDRARPRLDPASVTPTQAFATRGGAGYKVET